MTQERSLDDISLKLQKLWKGTLYISVIALYILLLGSTLVFFGYKAALLSLFIIAVIQLFRYIASDVDRLGLIIDSNQIEEASELSEDNQKTDQALQEKNKSITRQYQSKMYFLLVSLIQIANLGLVYQIYSLSSEKYTLATFLGLLVVELLFRLIRKLNHDLNYEIASYGIKEAHPLSYSADSEWPNNVPADTDDRLDRQLAKLKGMAERGEISQAAYEEVRDRELVQRTLNEF